MSKNILVVEDDPELLKMECMLLSSSGFEVVGVEDGEKALAYLADYVPDLVLLDVMMPGIDGFEVCRRIKSNERSRLIPVIMLTAKASFTDMSEGKRAGADIYLPKPFRSPILLDVVRRFIQSPTGNL